MTRFHHRSSRVFVFKEAFNFRLQSNRLSGENYLLPDRNDYDQDVDGYKFILKGAFNIPQTKSSPRSKNQDGGDEDCERKKTLFMSGNGSTSLFHNSYTSHKVKGFLKSMSRKKRADVADPPKEINIVKFASTGVPVGFISMEMGKIYECKGSFLSAIKSYDEALRSQTETFGEGDNVIVVTLLHRARILKTLGYQSQSNSDIVRAARIQHKHISKKSSHAKSDLEQKSKDILLYADILMKLGSIQIKRKKLEEALGNYYTALSFRQKYLGERHKNVGDTWFMIGRVYHMKRHFDFAVHAFLRSLDIYSFTKLSRDHPSMRLLIRYTKDKSMYAFSYKTYWDDSNIV